MTRIGDPRALPTLWHLFSNAPDRRTRHTAGRGLARIDGPAQYTSVNDPRVRRTYLWLLGHKPAWKRTAALISALNDEDAITRARAVAALARRGDPANAEHIRPLLDDPDPRVRANAATTLARLGGDQVGAWLDAHRSDPHPDVQSAITAALRHLEPTPDTDQTADPARHPRDSTPDPQRG